MMTVASMADNETGEFESGRTKKEILFKTHVKLGANDADRVLTSLP